MKALWVEAPLLPPFVQGELRGLLQEMHLQSSLRELVLAPLSAASIKAKLARLVLSLLLLQRLLLR